MRSSDASSPMEVGQGAPDPPRTRKATCSCRNVELVLAGPPRRVYACACLECQRSTGSAFAYRAIYPESAIVSQMGDTRSWRRVGPSGQWLEQTFCPNCGSILLMRAEALKYAISVSAGCLEDADFPPPQILHWPGSKFRWLGLEGVPDAVSP